MKRPKIALLKGDRGNKDREKNPHDPRSNDPQLRHQIVWRCVICNRTHGQNSADDEPIGVCHQGTDDRRDRHPSSKVKQLQSAGNSRQPRNPESWKRVQGKIQEQQPGDCPAGDKKQYHKRQVVGDMNCGKRQQVVSDSGGDSNCIHSPKPLLRLENPSRRRGSYDDGQRKGKQAECIY